MEKLNQILLVLHVVAGGGSLLSGLFALIFKKGGKSHQRSGRIFVLSMLGVCITALLISFMKENRFLFSIGIFTFYQVIAGYRSIKNKSLVPNRYEWLLLVVAGLNALQMVFSGNIVLIVFGSLSLLQSRLEYRIFKKAGIGQLAKNDWLKRHIGMMMGSYIATLTAFLVVNIKHFEPAWLPWIFPTLVGVPFIVYFTRKFIPPAKAKA